MAPSDVGEDHLRQDRLTRQGKEGEMVPVRLACSDLHHLCWWASFDLSLIEAFIADFGVHEAIMHSLMPQVPFLHYPLQALLEEIRLGEENTSSDVFCLQNRPDGGRGQKPPSLRSP